MEDASMDHINCDIHWGEACVLLYQFRAAIRDN